MPWKIVKEGDKHCVKKSDTGETVKCHESEGKAKAHMKALYANVHESAIAEMSLTVVKASYEKSESDPNKKRRILMVSSDTDPDLYDESMSKSLFQDFVDHINNKHDIPEPFKSAICEDYWCGGMPYISIAHFGAGKEGKNIPGTIESVYIDGERLKSKAYLHDTPLGRKLFDALCDDLEKHKSGVADHKPVRVSIGFLDLEHEHVIDGKTVTFTRTDLGQKCTLCADGVGGKIYKKGYLVHEAATRVPVNQRTEMALEEKSMSDILTKKDDAASIVGEDLAEELEQKSLADDVLVVKSEETKEPDATVKIEVSDDLVALLNTVKSELDEVKKSLGELQARPVVEESMEQVVEKSHEKEEVKEEEKKEEEVKSVSATNPLDEKFEQLKSALATGKVEAVQAVFNALGQEVEKSFTPAPPSATDIAAIVKSAVDEAVTPLKIQIAQLTAEKGAVAAKASQHPVTRALQLKPAELTQKSQSPQLTQIQKIARRSVGLEA